MSEQAAMPVQFAKWKNGQTCFFRQGEGEAVVLIHGVGLAASIWGPQFEALSRKYCVIAYDFLGHGGSTLPSDAPTLAEYSDQLLSLIDTLGLAQVHVVGHSMGALIALEFALAHPDRVISVAALNAVYCRTPEQRLAVEQRSADLTVGGGVTELEGTLSRWLDERFNAEFPGRVEQVRRLLSSVDPVGYARAYRIFARSDEIHRGRLGDLAMPSLFMTGELDPNSNPAMSKAMATAAVNGKFDVIEGERHMMCVTAPAEVNQRLLEFLDSTNSRHAWTQAATAMAFDQRAFRNALGSYMTGVTVIATLQSDGAPRGFTANSFSSVSLDPPLIQVSIAKTAASYATFASAQHFSVSVLAESQQDVSRLFASRAPDKFSNVAWRKGPTGSPLIDGAVAWFDCRAHDVVVAGDHAILIGEVIGFDSSTTGPLGYCQGAYVSLGLSQKAIAGSGPRTRVGAILEQDGDIILIRAADGSLDLPTGVRLEPASDPATLMGTLRQLGLNARLGFLFAVFEDAKHDAGVLSVYYRGVAQGPVPAAANLHLAPLGEIPWQRIQSDAIRSMLERYARERSEDAFGIYVGNAERGTVQAMLPGNAIQPIQEGLPK